LASATWNFPKREPNLALHRSNRVVGMMRRLATLCGVRSVRPAAKPPGVSPDPNSAKAESYVTSNGADKPKEEVLAVKVTSVEDAAPNVKLVTLEVREKQKFAFRPGQWVDFYAPGVEKPGGYSIASSPGRFARDGTFALAVRASRSSACGHWVHAKCQKGDEARIRVGGKFFASEEDLKHPLVLVAGGIGIAPLVAMLQTFVEEVRRGDGDAASHRGNAPREPNLLRAVLLCSTKNPSTQPMVSDVLAVAEKSGGSVKCVFHRTDDGTGDSLDILDTAAHVSTRRGRVTIDALREALSDLEVSGFGTHRSEKKPPLAFLCGPPAMSDAAEAALLELGIPQQDVRLERWW